MCGERKPNANKGDFVSFGYKEGGNGRHSVDVKSIQVKQAEVVQAGAAPMGRMESTFDKRQETIEYQAARNSAIAAANVILTAGALKLPAKEADKYKVVVELIHDLTGRYFAETKTLGKGPAPEEVKAEAEMQSASATESGEEAWD